MLFMISIRFWKESRGGATTNFMNIFNGLKIFFHTITNSIKNFLEFLGISYFLSKPIVKKVEKTHGE